MNNLKYNKYREKFLRYFCSSFIKSGTLSKQDSPCGKYHIRIDSYSHKEKKETFNYSKAYIYRKKTGELIFEITRNFSHFWFTFHTHSNGMDYLLCGEDYQGYCLLNLTEKRKDVYFPTEGYDGMGFCWTAAYPSPDSKLLAVDGCYWACPYQLMIYDFTEPERLPYREVESIHSLETILEWKNEKELEYLIEIECRKSDGKLINELDEQIIEELEKVPGSIECKLEKRVFRS